MCATAVGGAPQNAVALIGRTSVTRRNLIVYMSFNDTLLDPALLEADANDLDPVEDPVIPADDAEDVPDDVVVPDPAGEDGEDEEDIEDEIE